MTCTLLALLVGACVPPPLLPGPGAAEPPSLLFESVRVFDGVGPEARGPLDVLVVDGHLAALGEPGSLTVPIGAVRIPGEGRMLLPGLWDSHVHLGGSNADAFWDPSLPAPKRQLSALVYSGVTTAVLASRDVNSNALLRRTAAGRLAGPRLLTSSRMITAVGGHPAPLFREFAPWPVSSFAISRTLRQVDTVEQARAVVRTEVATHAPHHVKIVFNSIPDEAPRLEAEVLRALIEAAAGEGRAAVVHIGTPEEALTAAEAGARVLMHPPWSRPLEEEEVARLAASGVAVVTTRRIHRVLTDAMAGSLAFTELERAVMVEGAEQTFAKGPGDWKPKRFSSSYLERLAVTDAHIGENLRRMHAGGVPLLAGTDCGLTGLFHGASLHRELAALVDLGLSPATALATATSEAARVFDPDGNRGVVREGAVADLLLVEGDPLTDITDTERVVGVWVAGRPMRRPDVGP